MPPKTPVALIVLQIVLLTALVLVVIAMACQSIATAAPPLVPPLGIAPTQKQIELGRKLFFDPLLSDDGTVSCATCHDPAKGWADGRARPVGVRGQVGPIHTPTILGSAYSPLQFWDGRTVGQPTQALQPIVNRIEMGNQSEQQVLNRLRANDRYLLLFQEAYGFDRGVGSAITRNAFGHAIAAFESTIVPSYNAPIDRRLAGDVRALSPDAEIGFRIFKQSDCMSCHKPPHFTDFDFHNNGMEFMGRPGNAQQSQGRAAIVANGVIRGFKTPTLRDIDKTAPYNHRGTFEDLPRVVLHYSTGGVRFDNTVDRNQDARIKPLNLSPSQQRYLVVFLSEAFSSGESYPFVPPPVLPR